MLRTVLFLSIALSACRTDDPKPDTDTLPSDTACEDSNDNGWCDDDECAGEDGVLHPPSEEVCDGVDNDCDGEVDEDLLVTFYADSDGDGYGDADQTSQACEAPKGFVDDDSDCDDSDPGVHPEALEICNGLDDDCDGLVDDEDEEVEGQITWYIDSDGDGYGDDESTTEACEQPSGTAELGGDCDDSDPAYHPGAEEDDCTDPADYNCDGSSGYEDADADGWPACEECDDHDDDVHPWADETCDGVDEDCDGVVDEYAIDAPTWYGDGDGDGYGDAATTTSECTQPSGYVDDDSDCDDTDAAIHPAATELCDGADNDCDGATDEDDAADASTWYVDSDGDGYGNASYATVACDQPSGWVADATDCSDGDATSYPGATELCDGADNDCDGSTDEDDAADASTWYADVDGDGFGDSATTTTACEAPSGYLDNAEDCDDGNPAINPAATELCDGADNDCDGTTDEDDAADASTWYADADGDGFGDPASTAVACTAPTGHGADDTDCDDTDAAINPAATEACDGVDNDCDGSIDEDDATDASTWYADDDGDGYGDASSPAAACSAPSGTTSDDSDCDDGNNTIHPGAEELCDGVDNDCDGSTDEDDASDASTWYADTDGDGYGDSGSTTDACSAPSGYVDNPEDCDDDDSAISPAATEICDGVDNDCDGLVDDDDSAVSGESTWYIDYDGDGYGSVTYSASACSQPSGYVADNTDCDDTNAASYPGGSEVCDDADNDCDGSIDEGATDSGTWYADADSDGYGDPSTTSTGCDAPSGYVADATDCDDTDDATHPGAAEVCDSADNDCDGSIDEDAVDGTTWYADADGDGYGDPSSSTEACDTPSGYVADDSDCDDTDASDTDSDGLQDCEDDDIDGDGLRNGWDAAPSDSGVVRGPTAGLGTDGDYGGTGVGWVAGDAALLDGGATAGDDSIIVDDASLLSEEGELLVLSVQGSDAGTHQFVFAAAIDGTELSIEPPLSDDYDSSSVVIVVPVPHYDDVVLDADSEGLAWDGSSMAPVVFRATGTVTISGDVDVSGHGFAGGDGVYGNSYDPYQGESIDGLGDSGVTTANDGGGGAYPRRSDKADGGAGGGYGTAGDDGTQYNGDAVTDGGDSYGDTELSELHLGSGGGGGSPDAEGDGSCTSAYAGAGGNGGGMVLIFAGQGIEVSGSILADGLDSDPSATGSCDAEVGGGGGGSGGTVHLAAPDISITGTVSAVGGLGGTSTSGNVGTPYGSAWGGDGGEGRVRLDYDALSGSTDPSAGYAGGYED